MAARIFSVRFIGRFGVPVAGTLISCFASRAQNGSRPPLSMISAVIASWPRVNSESAMRSPLSSRRSIA